MARLSHSEKNGSGYASARDIENDFSMEDKRTSRELRE